LEEPEWFELALGEKGESFDVEFPAESCTHAPGQLIGRQCGRSLRDDVVEEFGELYDLPIRTANQVRAVVESGSVDEPEQLNSARPLPLPGRGRGFCRGRHLGSFSCR
jgi:hypothetical protein